MAYTEEHLAALEEALAKGEKLVRFGDKTVEYRSVEELKLAIREVKRDLAEQVSATGFWPRSPRHIRVMTRKGF
ncbi:Phage tail protein [Gammaproteobacteria bacterium]